jgi:hypothetical protein
MAYTDNTTGGRVIMQGILPCTITLGESCEVGDLLGVSTGWKRALATAGSTIDPVLVAGDKGATGDIITAYPAAVIGGISGATAGGTVYLAEAALYGETTQTAPSDTGDIDTKIGMALSDTQIFVFPGFMPVYEDADHRHA